jgi:hypothetical protein
MSRSLIAHARRRSVQQQALHPRHHDLSGALIPMGQLAHQPVGLRREPAHSISSELRFHLLRGRAR